MFGCHWTILNVQGCNKPFIENVSLLSLSLGCRWRIPDVQDVTNLFSECSGCHWPVLIIQDVKYWYLISKCPGCHCHCQCSSSQCLVFKLCKLSLTYSQSSGCHWRIPNQDVISLFSKCSGCHWPLLIIQDVKYWYLISKCPGCHCHCQCSSSQCLVFKLLKLSLTYFQIVQTVIGGSPIKIS
jgi:hypothetical protein